jgi:hypothetical protein
MNGIRKSIGNGLSRSAFAFVAVASLLLTTANARAGCGNLSGVGLKNSNWHSQFGHAQPVPASLLMVSDGEAGIVGFWHVKFVSKGSEGIPDGTEIDAGYSQWHSDGTEIMNSGGRSPLTGDFCLGVWEQVGADTYKLNHFGASWNATGSELVGPGRIQEEVTLASNKKSFSGTFMINQYSESGTLLAHVQGMVTGTRIDVNTTASSIF